MKSGGFTLNAFVKRHWFKLAAAAVILAIAATISYPFLGNKSPYKVIKTAPAFALQDWDGKPVSLADTNGKIRLVYFYWSSCPDVCSPTTFMLSKVQDQLVKEGSFGKSTSIISITFDPQRDTPAVIKEFAATFHADPKGWLFLRGEEQPTMDLAEKYGNPVMKDKDGNFSHYNYIMLVDKKGNILHQYDGMDANLTANQIADDMIRLAK
jgi:protein SCO1/2